MYPRGIPFLDSDDDWKRKIHPSKTQRWSDEYESRMSQDTDGYDIIMNIMNISISVLSSNDAAPQSPGHILRHFFSAQGSQFAQEIGNHQADHSWQTCHQSLRISCSIQPCDWKILIQCKTLRFVRRNWSFFEMHYLIHGWSTDSICLTTAILTYSEYPAVLDP